MPGSLRVLTQKFIPNSGDTIQPLTEGYSIFVTLDSTGPIASLTLNFPTTPLMGHSVKISSSQNITSLTLVNGSILNPITTIAAGGFAGFTYDGSQWRRTT